MRLVFKPRGANAGLNRYKGKGIYKSIGRKVPLTFDLLLKVVSCK